MTTLVIVMVALSAILLVLTAWQARTASRLDRQLREERAQRRGVETALCKA